MKRHSHLAFPLVMAVILFLSFCTILARAQELPPQQQAVSSNTAAIPDAKSDKAKSTTTLAPDEIMDPNDPQFGIPKMPKGKVSLIGGTVEKIDPIRQRLTLRTFGSNQKMQFGFDERSHIYRDGVESTYKGVQRGERVYVDSMLDGTKLFARNVRVVTSLRPADARGQIVNYDARRGVMTVRDDISSVPVTFRVDKETQVKGSGAESHVDLVPGSLVAVRFNSDHRKRDIAQEVTVLAMPGNMFTFTGKVTHLDMKSGVMAVENTTDNKLYDLQFDPGTVSDDVTVGSQVEVKAEFVGKGYRARSVAMNTAQAAPQQ